MALILEIKGESRQAAREIRKVTKKAGRDVKKLEKTSVASANRIQSAWGGVAKVLGPLGVGLGLVTIANSIKNIITDTIRFQDSIAKLSTRLGESTEFLSEMSFVAERAGVSFQSLSTGIQRANRRIAEAASGTGEAKAALEELGIQLRDNTGQVRSFEDILPELADSINGLSSDSDKLRIAFKLFDTEGVTFLQFLKEGAVGIEKVRGEARKFGVSLSEETTARAEEATNAIANLNAAFGGLTTQLSVGFIPAVTQGAKAITAILTAAGDPESKLRKFLNALEIANRFLLPQLEILGFAASKAMDLLADSEERVVEAGPASEEGIAAWQRFNQQVQQAKTAVTGIAEAIEKSRDPLEGLIESNERLTELEDEGLRLWDEQRTALEGFNESLHESVSVIPELPEGIQIAAEAAQDLQINVEGIASELVRAAKSGDDLVKVFLKLAIQSALSQIPGLGPAAAIFAGFFQHGGSFQVPGSGGPDSQLVAFRGTPGEQVTISPPGVTNNNTRNVGPVSLNFPNVRTIDKFTLQTEILPLMQEILEDGSTLNATGALSDR